MVNVLARFVCACDVAVHLGQTDQIEVASTVLTYTMKASNKENVCKIGWARPLGGN